MKVQDELNPIKATRPKW